MRISDWSSDVCSSDLGEYLDQIFDRHEGRCRPRHRRETGQRGGDHHQFAHRVAGSLALKVEDHPEPAIGDEGKGMRRIEHLRSEDREYLVEEIGSQHGRSEEHTSELQSLMRISYAVICLTKNQTKITS